MNTDNKQLPIKREDYAAILQHAVAVIEHARMEIAKHVNGNVASAYWEIGNMLHERKIESGHGDGVVRQLSVDLKERYPKMGLSPRNLWDMKKFYNRFSSSDLKLRQAVAVLPWGIFYVSCKRLAMMIRRCFIMRKRPLPKVGIAICCSML